MLRIRKDDQVMVITGSNKGKTGKVLNVFPQVNRVIIEHVNVVKKTQRPTQQNPKGGFVEIEASIHISNVMLIDKKTNKPTRIRSSILKDGSKVRLSAKTGEVI